MLRDRHVACSITHKTGLFDLISAKQTRKRRKKWKNSAFPLIFKTEGTTYIFDAPCALFCQMAAAVKWKSFFWEKRGKIKRKWKKKWRKIKCKACKIKFEPPGKIIKQQPVRTMSHCYYSRAIANSIKMLFPQRPLINKILNNIHREQQRVEKNGLFFFCFFYNSYYRAICRCSSVTSELFLTQLSLYCTEIYRKTWGELRVGSTPQTEQGLLPTTKR